MKAMLYTIEAILGAIIVLIGIMSIFPIQQQEEMIFSDVGYSCLSYLDQGGFLRYYAVNDMTTELNNSLKNCLPAVTEFKFKICSSSDCKESTPTNKNVYLSSYIIAGENSYNKRLINLWVWLK
jgi:hypothetical protein